MVMVQALACFVLEGCWSALQAWLAAGRHLPADLPPFAKQQPRPQTLSESKNQRKMTLALVSVGTIDSDITWQQSSA